jgi:outer membrane lipoprotein SlyB
VPGTVLVGGVSITYEDEGQTFNSAQVGQICEYVPGKAIVVETGPGTTRIQPNATCPVQSKT